MIRPAVLAALGLAALAACMPPPPPSVQEVRPPAPSAPPAPVLPPEPQFLDGRTYAVIEIADWEAPPVLRTFCDVTVLRRYRLRYNRENWPTCSSRELLIGASRPDEEDTTGAELDDGRRLRVWEVFDIAAGADAAPLEGRYVLAARTAEQDTIEVYTGRLPVYRVVPGKIHYLGRMDEDGPVSARDAQGFARAFRARFPDVPRGRLETSALGTLEVACSLATGSTEERINGFDCLGKRGRGRYF